MESEVIRLCAYSFHIWKKKTLIPRSPRSYRCVYDVMYSNKLWAAVLLNVLLTMFIVVSTTMLFCLFQLYEINDDPKRKEFLDDLFSFMQKRGKSIQSVVHRQYVYCHRLCCVHSVDYGGRTLNFHFMFCISVPRLESHSPARFVQMFLGENCQRCIRVGCL